MKTNLVVTLFVSAHESEVLSEKVSDALVEIAGIKEFREGSYDSGRVFQASNGVSVVAEYEVKDAEEPAAA